MADDPLADALDETEETEEETEEEPYVAPTQEQWKAHQAALAAEKAKRVKANDQAKKLREKLVATNTAPSGSGDSGSPSPADTAAASRAELRAARAEAKAALLAAGADSDLVELALGKLKAGTISFNDDDEPEGVEDWVDEIQEKYPRLFKAQRQSGGRPGSLDAGAGSSRTGAAGGSGGRKLSYGQRVMQAGRRTTR